MYSADSNEASNNRVNSNKNLLVAQINNLSDPNKARSVKHLSFKPSPSDCPPTAAESLFPWRRDKSYQSLGFGILHALNFYNYSLIAPNRKVFCTFWDLIDRYFYFCLFICQKQKPSSSWKNHSFTCKWFMDDSLVSFYDIRKHVRCF
jgi:hypothetical protein